MSKQTDFDKLDLLGVEIDAAGNTEAIRYICAHAAPGQPANYVVKPYVEFLDRAYHDEAIRDLLNGAQLAVPDGVALIWAAHYLYAGRRSLWRFWRTLFAIVLAPDSLRWPLPDRAAGINFVWPLLEAAATHKLRVFVIGRQTPDDIASVADHISRRISGLTIAGTRPGLDPAGRPGHVTDAWLAATAGDIRDAHADLILVGMGFPLQETVCAYLASHLEHGVLIGEGGTFDYESFGGTRAKAPAWVQRIGLEWAWRLLLQPQRLRRQLAIPRFIWRIWRNR